jgi:ABC-type bacteriocin/lantibiotic exporter with double-glycine peptidase domain
MFQLSEEKLFKPFGNDIDRPQIKKFLKKIIAKDTSFLWMVVVYGVLISLLSLAVPMSVQFLINSVSFTAMMQPVIVLGLVLLVILIFCAVLYGLQFYVTEIFQRRFFSRIASEVGLCLLNAEYKTFEEANQTEMVNRFFEAISIQKTIPKFLTKSFALILQSFVGLALVAFYHPVFLLFSLAIIGCLYLIWKTQYRKAITSSFYESRRKLDVAGWLQDIARGHVTFKSKIGHDYAKFKINFLTGLYLKERKRHFRSLFTQTILLLVLYVLASVVLLVVGGWLVIKGQLTIGQLVAAELVLSAALYGFSQFGRDLENFYDLVASCEKLSQFYNIPSDRKGGLSIEEERLQIVFDEAQYRYLDRDYKFDLTFESGKNYAIATGGFSTKKIFIDLICGFREPIRGSIAVNGKDLKQIDLYDFRSKIAVINNSPLIESTVGEYLTCGRSNVAESEINAALRITGLEKTIMKLPDGLNSRMIPSGWPFSESEKILLKIARILIQKPKLIIITEVLDMLVLGARQKILSYLTQQKDVTTIYFSHRVDGMMDFDSYIFLDKASHRKFPSIEALDEFERATHS